MSLIVPTGSCLLSPRFAFILGVTRTICTSSICPASRFPEKRRYYQRSLGYEQGSLTDQPDWSYADGRPAPLTGGRREERVKQMKLAKKIIDLLGEVDYAVDKQREMEQREQDEKQKILDDRLKPKGSATLASLNDA